MEKPFVGLWLDHKKAVMTICTGDAQKVVSLRSKMDRWSKATGGSKGALPYTYNGGGVSDKQDHRRDHALHDFYAEIFEKVKDAGQIYLMGPGMAKKELKKFLEERHLGQRIAALEDKDNLTDNQIAAETRTFFKIPNSKVPKLAKKT